MDTGVRPILWAYLIYSALAGVTVASTDLRATDVAPGMLLLWLNLVVYWVASHHASRPTRWRGAESAIQVRPSGSAAGSSMIGRYWLMRLPPVLLIVIGLTVLASAVVIGRVFAGVGPAEVVSSLGGGSNRYGDYIQHDQILRQQGLSMWPFLLLMMYKKFFLLYGVVCLMVFAPRPRVAHWMFVGMCVLAQVYGSLARGTTFEVFELAILLIFALAMRARVNSTENALRKHLVLVAVLALGALLFFIHNVRSRGEEFGNPTDALTVYDEASGLPHAVATLASGLYDYWGFGIYYASVFIDQVWLADRHSAFAGLFPAGLEGHYSTEPSDVMDSLVVLSGRWRPDMVLLAQNWGYLGLLASCAFLGWLYRRLGRDRGPISVVIQYFVLMQMISFPIGNFVVVSSDNRYLATLLLAGLFARRWRVRGAGDGPPAVSGGPRLRARGAGASGRAAVIVR